MGLIAQSVLICSDKTSVYRELKAFMRQIYALANNYDGQAQYDCFGMSKYSSERSFLSQ